MKKSTGLAVGAGVLTTVVGITAAVLCPVAGAAVCGYYAWQGLSTMAALGFMAKAGLTAAAVAGGGMIGSVAAPVVGFLSVAAGGFVGSAVKLVSGGLGKLFSPKNNAGNAPVAAPAPAEKGGAFKFSVKSSFGKPAVKTPANDANAAEPQVKKPSGPAL